MTHVTKMKRDRTSFSIWIELSGFQLKDITYRNNDMPIMTARPYAATVKCSRTYPLSGFYASPFMTISIKVAEFRTTRPTKGQKFPTASIQDPRGDINPHDRNIVSKKGKSLRFVILCSQTLFYSRTNAEEPTDSQALPFFYSSLASS